MMTTYAYFLVDTSRTAPDQSMCCLLCKHTRHGIARLHGRVKSIRSKTLVDCIAIGEVDIHCVDKVKTSNEASNLIKLICGCFRVKEMQWRPRSVLRSSKPSAEGA